MYTPFTGKRLSTCSTNRGFSSLIVPLASFSSSLTLIMSLPVSLGIYSTSHLSVGKIAPTISWPSAVYN